MFNGKGPYLAVAMAGAIFAYAGIRGKSVTQSLQAILLGQSPASTPQITGIGIPADQGPAAATPSGSPGGSNSGILNDAMKYVGVMYKWGGANPNGWDCSGFVNYVLGHDLNLPLPGGISGFQGTFHGPVTGQWFVTSLCTTIPRAQAQPGDLVIWLTHMGIVTDAGAIHMVNAYSTGHPTAVTPVDGMVPGEPMRIRRYTGTVNVVKIGGPPTLPAGFGG